MQAVVFLLPGVVAALLSLGLTPVVRRLAVLVGAIDRPSERRVHTVPIPRLGGLAVVASVAVLLLVAWGRPALAPFALPPQARAGLLWGCLPILAVSIWDDIRSVGAWTKLAAHIVGAVIAVSCGVALNPSVHVLGYAISIGYLAVPLSILWLVGITNAFNLMDGLDGLAAGLALISAGTLVPVFMFANQPAMGRLALVLAGALVGFLPYNMYPARIFLGDTGATAIGFFLGCLTLSGGSTLSAGFSTTLPWIVVGLPVAETGISIVRRVLRRMLRAPGVRVFKADLGHFHHKLLAAGFGHRRAVWLLYGVGLAVAGVTLLSILLTAQNAGFLLLAAAVAGYVGISRLGYEELAVVRNGLVLRLYDMPVLRRSFFVVLVDVFLAFAAVFSAIVLKSDDWTLRFQRLVFYETASLLAPVLVTAFWFAGMYRGAWRMAGVNDFVRATKAVVAATGITYVLAEVVFQTPAPVSVFVISGLLLLAMVNGLRVSYRVFADARARTSTVGNPALIYGAGFRGVSAIREMRGDAGTSLRPVGFIDDDPNKLGRLINGVRVLGPIGRLEDLLRETGARVVVVSSPSIPDESLHAATAVCSELGVQVLRLDIRFSSWNSVSSPEGQRRLDFERAVREKKPPAPTRVPASSRPVIVPLRSGYRVGYKH